MFARMATAVLSLIAEPDHGMMDGSQGETTYFPCMQCIVDALMASLDNESSFMA